MADYNACHFEQYRPREAATYRCPLRAWHDVEHEWVPEADWPAAVERHRRFDSGSANVPPWDRERPGPSLASRVAGMIAEADKSTPPE